MHERTEKLLKYVCLALGALMLYRLSHVIVAGNPAAHLTIPALPALAGGSNAPAVQPPGVRGTNGIAAAATTNLTTNAVVTRGGAARGSNSAPVEAPTLAATNAVARGQAAAMETNSQASAGGTNSTTNMVVVRGGTRGAINLTSGPEAGMPAAVMTARGGRGAVVVNGMPAGMGRGGPAGPVIPPEIKPQVDKIISSEILGTVVRPLPMALFGIADNQAFLRTPTGQTGRMKEGDELGGIKLLRIGINRVLIEENGQPRELMIFAGLGGESLMPKPKPITNETNK